MPRALFTSFHAYSDTTSGAAASVRDLFTLLGRYGWTARALAGPKFDRPGATVSEELARQQLKAAIATHPTVRVHRYEHAGVPAAALDMPATAENDVRAWALIAMTDHLLRRDRPDVVVTFGGGWVGRALLAVARHHGVPTVFWLRNHEYANRDLLAAATSLCVPSEHSRRHFRTGFDLDATAIPSPIDPARVVCDRRDSRYVTFVNPHPAKGVFYFAGIARELFRRRPDIPLLVVESRACRQWLDAAGVDVSRVRVMPNTRDPRDFFSLTRLLLVPSLWDETFARVAAEGMFNGIPALCSDRAGLPETVGPAGYVFPVPEKYRPDTTTIPTADEIAPWVETIERLFDDDTEYARRRDLCLHESERFRPEVLGPRYDEHFRTVAGRSTAPRNGIALESAAASLSGFLNRPVKLDQLPRWDDRVMSAMLGV